MKEISIIVPPETKVFKLEKQFNKNTEPVVIDEGDSKPLQIFYSRISG